MTRSRWGAGPIALLIVVLGASTALARPKVAVLGLEVKGGTSAIDKTSTSIAHELTEGLRARAGPYSLAPKSDRELIDQKLIKNCDDEGTACMAAIGTGLGADFIIYGRVEKESDGYTATMHLLDVAKQARLNTIAVPVPAGTEGDEARAMAKKAYADLIGAREEVATGILVIKSNAEGGKVLLDDQGQGRVENGIATVTNLGEGRYTLAIEAKGMHRKEVTVVVRNDETTTESVMLAPIVDDDDDGVPSNPWKPAFGVSGALALGLGVVSLYAYVHTHGVLTDQVRTGTTTKDGKDVTPSDCGGTSAAHLITSGRDHVNELCTWYHVNIYTGIAAGVLGAGTVVFGYLAYIRTPSDRGTARTASRHPRTPQVSWTPIVSPEVTGGSLQIAW
jgi:hypothetical protein